MGELEKLLSEASTEEDLWAAIDPVLSIKVPTYSEQTRFTSKAAKALFESAARIGMCSEDFVMEYYRRLDKTRLDNALTAARSALNSDRIFVDAHKGYDLQHAVGELVGMLLEQKVGIPTQLLQTLAEHGEILARHAKANDNYGYQLMPLVEAFAPVLDERLLTRARASTSRGLIEGITTSGYLNPQLVNNNLGHALNTLQRNDLLDQKSYNIALRILAVYFESKQETQGFLSTWDWSTHIDDVYGKFIISMLDPLIGNSGRVSHAACFTQGYQALTGIQALPPSYARIMQFQIRSLERPVDQSIEEQINEIAKGSTDAEARTALEKAILAELEGPFLPVVSPAHLREALNIYCWLGGDPKSEHLIKAVSSYVGRAIFNSDLREVVSLGELVGMGPSDMPGLYKDTISALSTAGRVNVREQVYDKHSIQVLNADLMRNSRRIVELSKITADTTSLFRLMNDIADAVYSTRFGIGLHYLCSLVVDYSKEFEGQEEFKPARDILGLSVTERLRDYFSQERERASKANIDFTFRKQTLSLYDSAHKLLFGQGMNERKNQTTAELPQKHRPASLPQPADSRVVLQAIELPPQTEVDVDRITVYLGAKNFDGTNLDAVERVRRGLEAKVGDGVHGVSGFTNLTNMVRCYGLVMTKDTFRKAAANGQIGGIVIGIYLPGVHATLDQNFVVADIIDFGNKQFLGSLVTTAPNPRPFGMQEVKAVMAYLRS